MRDIFTKHFWKLVTAVVVILGIGTFLVVKNPEGSHKLQATSSNDCDSGLETCDLKDLPQVETLTFGSWTPSGNRSVLMTIESDAEVELISKISGSVKTLGVEVGDRVKKGQVLLRFNTTGGSAIINYENAIQSLQSTRSSTQSSVDSSRIALENAQTDLEQTRRQEGTSLQKTIESLRTQARNTESRFTQALNLMDQWLGVSNQYRSSPQPGTLAIGGRDRIGRNQNINQVRALLRAFDRLDPAPQETGFQVVMDYAQSRLDYSKSLQETFNLFERLAQGAVFNQSFSQTDLDSLLSQIISLRSSLNSDILSLNNALEDLRNGTESQRLSILSAENRLRSAQTSYEVALSSARSQITSAENQVRSLQVARDDQTLKAPLSGIISEKFINLGTRVVAGQPLLRITNPQSSKKAVAFLSKSEYQRVISQEDLSVVIEDESFEVEARGVNARLDPASQKMRLEFTLPEEKQESILVGQIGKVLLPANGFSANLLPLSAISFEPDGPEVLIVNDQGVTERKKIVVGKLKSDAMEILSGLEEGDFVLKYRNRNYAGQKVKTDQLDSQ